MGSFFRGRFLGQVRVFLTEFFFPGMRVAWTCACFLVFFFSFINSRPRLDLGHGFKINELQFRFEAE